MYVCIFIFDTTCHESEKKNKQIKSNRTVLNGTELVEKNISCRKSFVTKSSILRGFQSPSTAITLS